MRRTGVGDLVVPFLVIGLTVYVLLRVSYESIPPLQYVAAVPLGALAVAEFIAARRVRAAVRHDPDATPMSALVIARCVALGKASSLVGSGVVGAAGALVVRVAPDARTDRAAASDLRVGAVLLVVSALLVGAALLLERAGIDPGSDDRSRRASPG